jgi:hypothetical protein
VLRSELNILKAKLEESESQKDSYHNALVVAENRVERLQSATVRETESRETRDKSKTHEEQKEDAVQSPVVSGLVIWLIGRRFDHDLFHPPSNNALARASTSFIASANEWLT